MGSLGPLTCEQCEHSLALPPQCEKYSLPSLSPSPSSTPPNCHHCVSVPPSSIAMQEEEEMPPSTLTITLITM